MEIFRSIDVQNRGFLTSADFRRLCVDLDVGLSSGQIVGVFGQLDSDHDGRISGDDFIRGHRAFTELFIASLTSVGKSPPPEDVGHVSEGGGATAWRRFLERFCIELAVLSRVWYVLANWHNNTPVNCSK